MKALAREAQTNLERLNKELRVLGATAAIVGYLRH